VSIDRPGSIRVSFWDSGRFTTQDVHEALVHPHAKLRRDLDLRDLRTVFSSATRSRFDRVHRMIYGDDDKSPYRDRRTIVLEIFLTQR